MRRIFLAVLLLTLPAAPSLFAQEKSDGDPKYESLRRELMKLGDEDQKYREQMFELMKKLAGSDREQQMKKFLAVVKKQDAIDNKNKRKLDRLVERYGWPTKSMVGSEASGAAFLVVQHGDPAYMKKYFPLIKAAAAKGEAKPGQAAMMEDRMLMNEGKKQIYGTGAQTDPVTNELKLWPIENEEEVDARRAAVGLPPLAEYLKMMGITYVPPKKRD
ncbi:MAG TPA: DUF6624 domain-containing protein [Pyrinomonadaceae bacterium]|nr:DUF6624 domain-containing protein [Pyrinomonadaceae bacterium]